VTADEVFDEYREQLRVHHLFIHSADIDNFQVALQVLPKRLRPKWRDVTECSGSCSAQPGDESMQIQVQNTFVHFNESEVLDTRSSSSA